MWKGVKGFWNLLKLIDPLPSARQKEYDDIPAHWYEDGDSDIENTEDEEIESDDCRFKYTLFFFMI